MKRLIFTFILFSIIGKFSFAQPGEFHNLHFDSLANRWDEAMPLGNGMLGALVWKKNNHLRISLDRADLWDERKALDLSKFNFNWVVDQVNKKDYAPVQKLGDHPYDAIPYPTKLPAAALEFSIQQFGKVASNVLDIKTALNTITFESGVKFNCYIHATKNIGYFSFENLSSEQLNIVEPLLQVHAYQNIQDDGAAKNSQAGGGLIKLGYKKGDLKKENGRIIYRQPTYDDHFFEVSVQWKKMPGNKIIGSWVIGNDKPTGVIKIGENSKEPTAWDSHKAWWKNFWEKSSITIPDSVIEKQYYLEMYKLGSASRPDAPAITLQSVWTADNGSLPPWKGDFHNDLNTQLSYWPVYSGNYLTEGESFINWLWKIKNKNQNYTKQYFGVDGLNVPGVLTLSGEPMGGWIQYSLGPTVAAWCAQHFYWQWKYSMDPVFLKTKAYPYLSAVATYLENITRLENGVRKLPLSSSPEYNDNSISAWFQDWTNFDLSLVKFLWQATAELADHQNDQKTKNHWLKLASQLPDYDVDETGLTVAPGHAMEKSHRHLSPYMSIFPLGLLDINEKKDQEIIHRSIQHIEKLGTHEWCGYSFSWMANIYARIYEGDSAAKQLRIFAENFCSPNSFHLNGDQKGGEHSSFTYRPFTLEGNFAFARGVHEMLLQNRSGYIQVFPAVPESWKNISFNNLRTEGAFLVSANKENGVPESVKIIAEQGGLLSIKLPFKTWFSRQKPNQDFKQGKNGAISIYMKKGESIVFENGYE